MAEEELEALEAIYGPDLTVESKSPLRVKIRIPLDVTPAADAELTFSCPADGSYPDRKGPFVDARLSRAVGFIQTALYAALAEEAQRNLGGPMVFALVSRAKEWLEDELSGRGAKSTSPQPPSSQQQLQLLQQQQAAAAVPMTTAAKMAAAACDLESEGSKDRRTGVGTPVTRESFRAWWASFLERRRQEKARADLLAQQQQRTEWERKMAWATRASGRQMFEQDTRLSESDVQFDQDFVPAPEEISPTPVESAPAATSPSTS